MDIYHIYDKNFEKLLSLYTFTDCDFTAQGFIRLVSDTVSGPTTEDYEDNVEEIEKMMKEILDDYSELLDQL